MRRLCSLGDLQFDHLDAVAAGIAAKSLGTERAIRVTAAKIAGANLPDQITTVFEMVLAYATFAGVVGEVAQLGALVHGSDCGTAQGAETHAGNVET